MKQLLFIAAAFICGITAKAQQKADDIVKVNTETYDFGKIKQGVPVSTFFEITNTSDKPVVIEKTVSIKFAGITDPKVVKITGEVLDEKAYNEYAKTNGGKKATQTQIKTT